MQEDTANLYQFLYHVIPVVSFRGFVLVEIIFADFIDAKLVSTHKNGKTSFYMLIIRSFFLTFHQLCGFVVQSESAKSADIFRS